MTAPGGGDVCDGGGKFAGGAGAGGAGGAAAATGVCTDVIT